MQTFKVGDYVVFAKEGETFSGTNKDIWLIEKIYLNSKSVLLKSICRDKEFETTKYNVIGVLTLIQQGRFDEEYFHEDSYNKYVEISNAQDNTIVGDTKMNYRGKTVMKRTTDANVSAAKVAATITAGKTLNSLVAKKVTPQLPMFVKGYADTAVGRVVIANLADFAVKQFMPTNQKANMAADAMMQAAMLELAESFDLESIVAELVDSVALEVPTE